MKKVLFLLICLLPSVATWAGARFNYSYEGQTLTYEIINDTEQTCMVVGHANAINEAVTIPRASEYDGELYLVVGIGDNAFEDCSSLTSITIPNSVTSIGKSVFYNCKNLKSVTIPNSVTSIGDSAFSWCSALTSVTIPNSVTSIGKSVFYGCSGLTSVTIPNSVTSIGVGVYGFFWGCTRLEIINVDTGNQNYSSADGVLFNKDKTTLYCYPAGKKTIDYQIPNSVTSIGKNAFRDCSSLTSVTIPNSVTSISNNAFEGCSRLTSVTIPNSVTSIGNYAFGYCSALTSVAIPNSVTSIGKYVFYNCGSLTSITIPNSVTSISNNAFEGCSRLTSVTIPNSVTAIGSSAFKGCTGLKEIYYGAENPVAGTQDIFSDYKNPTLYIKASAMDKIKATIPWSLFEKIEAYGFSGIDDITVDNKQIDYSAEYEVYNLNGQKIGDSLENLAPGVYIIGQGRKVEKRMIK